ncbi:MAG TPA: hypothetical protein VFU15_14475 [Bacteroidia bacterium]|nr:hypothetical protein [Bacteroidia bacterium]
MIQIAEFPVLIDKSLVINLSFPVDEVLPETDKIAKRRHDLMKALSLGNLDHAKVKILFRDNQGLKVVETTVWAVTDQRIVLKSGTTMPIHRIVEVII